MKVRFSHEDGWSGGQWQFDGVTLAKFKAAFGIDPFPRRGMKAELVGPSGLHSAITSEQRLTVTGVDHDHGHRYDWRYEEPMFLVGNCPFPIPANQIWKDGYTILLEVPDGSH